MKNAVDTCLSGMEFVSASIPGMQQLGEKDFRDFLFSKTLLSDDTNRSLLEMYRKKGTNESAPMFTTLTDGGGNRCFFVNMPCRANLKNNEECQEMFSPFTDM